MLTKSVDVVSLMAAPIYQFPYYCAVRYKFLISHCCKPEMNRLVEPLLVVPRSCSGLDQPCTLGRPGPVPGVGAMPLAMKDASGTAIQSFKKDYVPMTRLTQKFYFQREKHYVAPGCLPMYQLNITIAQNSGWDPERAQGM